MEQNVCAEENIPNYAKCMKIKTDLCVRRKGIYYVAYPYMLCNVTFFLIRFFQVYSIPHYYTHYYYCIRIPLQVRLFDTVISTTKNVFFPSFSFPKMVYEQ